MTGAIPTPRHELAAAPAFLVVEAPPPQFAVVPPRLDMWGNDRYGVCVTSEEAFAKACYSPEIFIPAETVVAWASRHGWLNGANLPPVMDAMRSGGFVIGPQSYNDGGYAAVNYGNELALQSALATGPVKLGMASSSLPSGAGNKQGWYAITPSRSNSEDHCTGLSGYGPAAYLYQQLGLPLPSGVAFPAVCYLYYTWSTMGVVSHDWLMGSTGEAWVRNPTTIGVPPLPEPVPPTPPTPPVPPVPPTPGSVTITLSDAQVASVIAQSGQGLSPQMTLAQLVALIESMQGLVPISDKMSPLEILSALQSVIGGNPKHAPADSNRTLQARMDLQDRAMSALIQIIAKKG